MVRKLDGHRKFFDINVLRRGKNGMGLGLKRVCRWADSKEVRLVLNGEGVTCSWITINIGDWRRHLSV